MSSLFMLVARLLCCFTVSEVYALVLASINDYGLFEKYLVKKLQVVE